MDNLLITWPAGVKMAETNLRKLTCENSIYWIVYWKQLNTVKTVVMLESQVVGVKDIIARRNKTRFTHVWFNCIP